MITYPKQAFFKEVFGLSTELYRLIHRESYDDDFDPDLHPSLEDHVNDLLGLLEHHYNTNPEWFEDFFDLRGMLHSTFQLQASLKRLMESTSSFRPSNLYGLLDSYCQWDYAYSEFEVSIPIRIIKRQMDEEVNNENEMA